MNSGVALPSSVVKTTSLALILRLRETHCVRFAFAKRATLCNYVASLRSNECFAGNQRSTN